MPPTEDQPLTTCCMARLQRMREEVEGEYGYPFKLDMARVKLAKEVKLKDRQLTQQQERHAAVLRGKTRELEDKTGELKDKTRELEDITRELEDKTREIEVKNMHLAHKDHEIARKDGEIASRDQEIAQQRGRIQQLQNEIQVNMARKDRELEEQRVRLQLLQEELHLRETQLREELQSQEAEISRQRAELSKHQGLPQKGAKVPLKLSLQLKWRRGPDMPFRLSCIQSLQVQGTLYVGGGRADDDNEYIVMTYDTSAGKWAMLPPYSTHFFGMTAIDNNLVLVGGRGYDNVFSKVLGVWSEDSKKWTHPYPDMTTPRDSCSAVVYKKYLVVAGGRGAGNVELSSVEVMNTDTKQWYPGPPTPIAWSDMKTTIVDDTCYFIHGYVYSVSLPALVSQLNSDSSAKDAQTWKELPQLPVNSAAPFSISGSLLAVGGYDRNFYQDVSALHLYQPDAGRWVKVADMPTPRESTTCTMISDKELLVAGGWGDNGRPATTDIAQIY